MLLLGCPGNGGDGGDTDAGTETETVVELVAPALLEPLDAELIVPVTRTEDIVLAVADITPGATRVVIDGESLGPLGENNRVGTLTAEALTLRMTGTMVPGEHSLLLRTPGGVDEDREPLESREVKIRITAAVTPQPMASVGETVSFAADAIFTAGFDSEGVLIAVDLEPDPPIATVFRGAGTGWDLGAPAEFDLVGFVPNGDPREAIGGCVSVAEPGVDDDRVRVVWRVGAEGTSVEMGDQPWPEGFVATRTVLRLEDVLDSAEYARLGRPLIYGSTVVTEVLRAHDAEQPLPGDRTLATVRISGSPPRPLPPQLTSVVGQNDIEFLGPALDPLGHQVGAAHAFAARVAGVQPVVFTVDRDSGALSTVVTHAADRLSLLGNLVAPMITVIGALESRQVFAPLHAGSEGARVMIRYFDDGSTSGASDASPSAAQLAMVGDPTGAAVATVIAGAPIYIVPMGVDAPSIGFVSTGPSPTVAPIENLACDEVAVPAAMDGIEGNAVQLACRRGRDVALGTLRAAE